MSDITTVVIAKWASSTLIVSAINIIPNVINNLICTWIIKQSQVHVLGEEQRGDVFVDIEENEDRDEEQNK